MRQPLHLADNMSGIFWPATVARAISFLLAPNSFPRYCTRYHPELHCFQIDFKHLRLVSTVSFSFSTSMSEYWMWFCFVSNIHFGSLQKNSLQMIRKVGRELPAGECIDTHNSSLCVPPHSSSGEQVVEQFLSRSSSEGDDMLDPSRGRVAHLSQREKGDRTVCRSS
jgi:hypothetical protein